MARGMLALALLASLMISSLSVGQTPTQRRDNPPNSGPRQLTFADILVRELRVRYPKEQLFVNKIVQMTNEGTFSQQFILAVVRHAQQRNIIFPFPYFQAMMIRIAEVKGVPLVIQ